MVDENQSYANWWGNEKPDADGWVIDSSMGTFRPHDNGWLYHLHLGWLYASPVEDDSLWIWSNEHRWLWTRKDVFPVCLTVGKMQTGCISFYDPTDPSTSSITPLNRTNNLPISMQAMYGINLS